MKRNLILTILLLFITANIAYASVNGTFNGFQIVKVISNGEEVTTSTPAILVDGTTMVPIRVLEQFGFVVEWDSDTYSVEITPPEPVVVEVPIPEETGEEETTYPIPAKELETGESTDTDENNTLDEPKPSNTTKQSTSSAFKRISDEPVSESITDDQTEEPEQEESVEEEEPDNTAACKRIRDKYAGKIAMLSYEGLTQGQMEYKKMQLEHQRDQELDDAGC